MLSFLLSTLLAADPAPGNWHRAEVTLTATAALVDPLADVSVEVTAPTGVTSMVRGFWDGAGVWKARFRTDATGEWRFATRSGTAALNALTGRVTIDPVGGNGTIRQRQGPIRILPGATFFSRADGSPFFWLGDTAWNGPLLSSDADWDEYLRTRVQQRFTVVQFNMLAPWRTAPADAEGRVAYAVKDGRLTITPEFFRRLDRRMEAIEAAGLVAAPVMLWAISGAENPGHALADDHARMLAQYLEARFGAFDVAWLLAGDGRYHQPAAVAKWTKLGRAVFGDRPTAPVTMHGAGEDWPFEHYRAEPWFGFIGYQSGHGDSGSTLKWTHSGPPAKNWDRQPPRPVVNLEIPYEGHIAYHSKKPLSDFQVRRSVYWSLLVAPPAGVTYGAHGVWSWQTKPGIPLAHAHTGMAPPWREAVKYAGAGQLKALRDFLDTGPWWELRPANDLLAEQPGSADPAKFIAAAHSMDGRLAIVYMPVGGEVRLNPAALPRDARAYWFDPRTGSTSPPLPAGAVMKARDDRDWVLVIRSS